MVAGEDFCDKNTIKDLLISQSHRNVTFLNLRVIKKAQDIIQEREKKTCFVYREGLRTEKERIQLVFDCIFLSPVF